MKKENGFPRKFRYGSASLGLTALVIAAVVLLNVVVSAICSEKNWFLDLTENSIYTLDETAENLLETTLEAANETREEENPVQIQIIFCAEPDLLCRNSLMRYVYYTAKALEQVAPESIEVSAIDVWDNPSLVDDYRNNSYSTIYQTDVIIACDSEYRICPLKSFFVYDSDDATQPWAYIGAKKFLSSMIAVTSAEAPICAITVGHGEPFDPKTGETEYTEFLKLIESAGYDIVFLDLKTEDIPENCRLLITFDPQEDFLTSFGGTGTVSEISKLDAFLGNAYSYMVFVDADTPKLAALEEYLAEWGIVIDRYQSEEDGTSVEGTFEILDPGSSLDTEGSLIIGQYQIGGLGASLTSDMREMGNPPKVLFGNAVSFSYSDTYKRVPQLANEETGTPAYTYGTYSRYEWPRSIHNVFCAGERAYAYARANGERLTDENGEDLIVDTYDPYDPYRLMTLTAHRRLISEGQGWTNANDASYVCAVGSVEFASNEVLATDSYGNTDALVGTLRQIGGEVVPVGLKLVQFCDEGMDSAYYTSSGITVWTVALMAVPAVLMAVAGICVLVKRKFY